MTFTPGQEVERLYAAAGRAVWVPGEVESVGYLGGVPCARVWLSDDADVTVCRLDQLRPYEPLGGLFAVNELAEEE